MSVFIASEFRCNIYKGEFYLVPRGYHIYKRYADAFGGIVLCSRFEKVDELSGEMIKANFIEDSIQIKSLFNTLIHKYDSSIEQKIKECDLIVVRCPSVIAYAAARVAKRINKRYLAESMCDGWDPYWNHGIKGKLIAPYMHINMRRCVKNASYALYVTEKYLQRRYPCTCESVHASNVVLGVLNQNVLDTRLKKIDSFDKHNFSIMTTADVDLFSKGHKYVLKAIKKLKDNNIKIKYYMAGAGNQSILREQAKKLGIEDALVFLGRISLEEVFEYLDAVDLYVHPSLQEGLPRAVIEAMSRACPCLGANTAGIPELIDAECVFKKASADAIVKSIERMIQADLKKYAISNFEHCVDYQDSKLNERRNDYFNYVKKDLQK